MQLFIPTRGRAHKQITLGGLPRELREQTILVVDHGEGPRYESTWKTRVKAVWELPQSVKGIAYVRQYIMDNSPDPHLVMLDDDITFFIKDENWRIVPTTLANVGILFRMLEEWLSAGVAHCGVTCRSINWDKREETMANTRMMHVLAYNRDTVRAAGCDFTKGVDSSFSMDDFHMTLQLFRAGHGNRLLLRHCISPSASNSAGGASTWRTLESHNKSAHKLKELHSEFVTVRERPRWRGMEGTRYDVMVHWRKAMGDK